MPDDESPDELEGFVADRVPNNEGEDGLGPSLPQTTSLKQPVNSPSKNFEGRNTRAAIRLQGAASDKTSLYYTLEPELDNRQQLHRLVRTTVQVNMEYRAQVAGSGRIVFA